MPDLVTHFAAAYFLKIPHSWARFRVPFYLGALLPDLLARSLTILYAPAGRALYSLHTPFVSVIVCFLIVQFFEREVRAGVRTNLLMGVTLHFCLDIFQKHVTGSYYWFFPFNWRTFNIGLIWPEDSLRIVPVLIIVMIAVEVTIQIQKRIKRKAV
ncbi:MAG: hypothetical protein JSV96_01545 [Candidatus Aminicenantes bacterium]|nr:MAG: hypothetical protein JSV96_01545 [Candidatus Aminicenantes bacterium]